MLYVRTFVNVVALILLLFWATAAEAQLNRGVLEGTVTDPTGAVVPEVEVTITSTDTNVSATTKTNGAGYYRAVDLVPGNYLAHFSIGAFTPMDITGIEVRAGQVIKVDAQLKLEANRQLIEVTAEIPLIETSASNFSASLETKTVQELPLPGRDIQQLIFLFPGINQTGGPPGSNFGFNSQYGSFPDPTNAFGSQVSVNGGQAGDNVWYLDGNMNLSGFAENVAVNPTPDAVQEFQVVNNGFAAEYGRTGGAVFNVVLKSGSNAVHGSLYEYLRNDATNARNPFTSIDDQGNLIKDRQLRFNNFGGTLGGPVYIPKLYDGRNKSFFFFSFDHQILHLLGNKVFTVPTARMRQGDFSEDADVISNGLWNPYSTVGPNASTGLFERTAFGTPVAGNPFGNNGCLASSVESGKAQGINTCNFSSQIPSNLMDPVANYFTKSFPLPNYNDPLSGCPMGLNGYKICNNFLGTVGSSQNPYNISIKIDHQLSEKSKLFVEWLYNPGKYNNYRFPWTGATFPNDAVGWGGQYPVDYRNQIIAIGNTYTLSPTVINEFRGSFSRQFIDSHPHQPYPDSITDQSSVQKLLAPIRIPQDELTPTPNWNMSAPGGAGIGFGPTQWVSMTTAAEAYTIIDNVTKIAGKHTFKAGLTYRLEHTAYFGPYPTYFDFGGELAQDPNTNRGGSGLAQFMMGAVATAGRNSATGLQGKPYNRFRYWGFYWQDDFRITPRFTLNFGVRYDLNGYFRSRYDPQNNFCLECPNETTGLKGKLVYSGDPELPNGHDIAPANKNSIAPRFNFAWSPFADQKTIIRGGFDVFYTNSIAAINAPGQSSNNMPGWAESYAWQGSFYPDQCLPFSGQCVAFPLSDTTTDKGTLTHPAFTTEFAAQRRDPLLGFSHIEFFTPPPHDPMVQSWNLEIQRELPGKMMLSVGYVGTHGTHLMGEPFRQFNYVHTADRLKYRTTIDANIPITDVYSGKTAALLEQVYGSPTLPRSLLLKPYPFYGAVESLQNNTAFDGTTVYHGMNVRVQKQYSHGLSFVAAYTYSKKINSAVTSSPVILVTDPIHWARSGNIGGRAGQLAWNGGYSSVFQDPDNRNADRALAADDIPHMLNIAATYELPVGAGKPFLNRKGMANALLGGWRFTSNFNTQSGVPLAIGGPCNELTCRPNLVGDPKFAGNRSREQQISQWINPAAFEPVFGSDQSFWANYDPTDDRAWQFGTAGPRLPGIRSPGFWVVDAALAKSFHITESKYFEFRWEVFNALNHQNLGFPDTNFCLPPGSDGVVDAVHQDGCQFGRITNIQTDPRSMQFALKFIF